MPTYDYACRLCGHRFEHFASMTDAALVRCPACERDGLQRLIGTGAGILFKGSGFYETDYKRAPAPKTGAPGPGEGKPDAAKADKPDAGAAKGSPDQPASKGTSGAGSPPAGKAPAKDGKPAGNSGDSKDKRAR